jgi:hypothetical protein
VTANFLGAITGPHTVTVDAPVTVGRVVLFNDNAYTLAGTNSLTLQAAAGSYAEICLGKGNHAITAPLNLASDTMIGGAGSLLAGNVNNSANLSVKTSVSAGNVEGTGSTMVATGAVLEVNRVRQAALAIDGGVTLKAGGGTSVVKSLAIAGTPAAPTGKLDVTNNSLTIDYTGAVGTLVGDVRQLLKSGVDSSGASGIVSSSSGTPPGTTVGYGDNAVLGKTTFGGEPVDASSVLVKFTYAGDSNLDGQVDITDLGNLATAWQTNAPWTGGDFDYSSFVDITDLGLLATNWQAGVGGPLRPQSLAEALEGLGLPGSAVVPEPVFVGLIGLCVVGVASRRRTRCLP